MNTRNAFYGLDENLRALAPKYDPPSTISSLTVSKNFQKSAIYSVRKNISKTKKNEKNYVRRLGFTT